MRIIFFFQLIMLSLASQSLSAQDSELISSKKLLKDFNHVVYMIGAHPAPYRHISEEDFNEVVQKHRQRLQKPATLEEFHRIISSMVALLKDGHSRVGWPYGWMKKIRKEAGAFPYKVHLSDSDDIFLVKHYGEAEGIPIGAQVLAINETSVSDFLEAVDPFISYERKEFRNAIIEDEFERYLAMHFKDTKDLSVKYKKVEEETKTVLNLPLSEWKNEKRKDQDERERKIGIGQPYDYTKLTDDVGLIQIFSFSVGDFDKYEFFLKKTFKQIAKDGVSNLILDVRGNYGGWPKVASALLHYLTNSYFKTMARSEMKVSRAYRNNFKARLPTGLDPATIRFYERRHSVDLNALFTGELESMVLEEAAFNEFPQQPDFSFSGNLFLLTDRRSYSASSSFAATFQCYQLGYIIGSETGGTKVFHANAIGHLLDQTKIPVWISTTRLHTACFHEEDEGITPDIEFNPTFIDLLSDQDAQLNYALFIIRKLKKQQEQKK